MYMKRNGLSSIRRSKTEKGACAHDHSRFVPTTAASTMQRRLGWRSSALHRCWRWDLQQPMRRNRRGKVARGGNEPREMLKMKQPPWMCMKTKDQMTICPTQKTPFLLGWTPFYAKTHVFCRNGLNFCDYLSPGDRILRFKM